ncbi:patatin phospholipase [Saudi moumouvirus]|uniref:Putative patatin phospholipase n=1 Tax=Moumouvirus sp. 'Monve' TaxID=1128131 RepID=H2EDM0_9VIRU|nr:putative patatin phospholipase [Moumouvirus Monve]AQN68555.1 patatin phospholipase [Saudi moumouvirus]
MVTRYFKINIKIKPTIDEGIKHAFFIEGGGTRGVYAAGVLKYLFEENEFLDLKNVEVFGGTSVGSYLSTALSLGYHKEDILGITKLIDLSKLIDSKYMFVFTAYRFLSKGFLYDDTGRQDIIGKILNYKIDIIKNHLGITNENFNGIDLTFGHLKQLINNFPDIYKHLLINTVDISRKEQIFMTTLNDNWDHIKLFDAMLASSSIPFVFQQTKLYYDDVSKKYFYDKLPNMTENYFVDGAVSNNNPLDYLLLHDELKNYNLWLLQFTNKPKYVNIDTNITLLKQLVDHIMGAKNNINMEFLHQEYQINIINLNSKAGALDIYTPEKVQDIIQDIYNQCLSGTLHFEK